MQYQKEIHEYLKNHKSEMLDLLGKLVTVRSVQGDALEGMPFGTEPAKALGIMLDACREYGFQTENLDNYAGSADLNSKKPELGILAHLDVVPEGDGWMHDPYQITYDPDSDKLFGRGTSDDKGPAVASLFAMRAVHDLQIPMKSGVRLIFGTNEENGSEDLAYYMKNRTLPPMVFTPDGDYPVINLEKGMIRLKLSAEFTDGTAGILKLDAGDVINAVPAQAGAFVKNISPETVQQAVHDLQKCYPIEIPETEIGFDSDNNIVMISVNGESAHASTPEKGRNALTFLLEILNALHLEGQQGEIIGKLAECFLYGETDGKSCGISASDELSGGLTEVLSVMKMNLTEMTAYVDIRFPVCCTGSEIISTMQKALAPVNAEALLCDEPHHTDENSPFVQTLLN
ncbi:MAG: Sapep family Mn(2+)-dependent dipeptidase, partial [Oscillospiraceae bacterium]|nr:Sapep family Mn(2+)-dependent dipeptidase [Oscillospiraceae bacterium]